MTTRIDAHAHLWNRALDPQDWIDPTTMAAIDRDFGQAELDGMLADTGISQAVIVQAANSINESIRLAQLRPSTVAGLVAWVDLAGDVSAQIDRIRSTATVGVVGVRHLAHIDPNPQWLLRDDVIDGMTELGRLGLSFDFVVRDWQLPQATVVAAGHPEVRFVLDHLGNPPAPGGDLTQWNADLAALAALPNVAAKLSGLTSGLAPGTWTANDLKPVVDMALSAFGAARLMYGSDWPLAELGGGAPAWVAAVDELIGELTVSERDRIYGGTATEVYSLG